MIRFTYHRTWAVGLIFCAWTWTSADAQTVLYVDVDATGANDGSSWADAFTELQSALAVAVPDDEIRVAQGTYRPDYDVGTEQHTGDREATFQLLNGVTIEGGYAGWGQPDPDDRDVEAYETILSGDLNADDGPDFANNDENSYHVTTGSGTDETAVLDGFTVTSGNAEGTGHDDGAGMYTEVGSPTLANCRFAGNRAADFGGGMHNYGGSPTLANCTFSGNHAFCGGGMYSWESGLMASNSAFRGNMAANGGGGAVVNERGNPTFVNCTFTGNSSGYSLVGGGGMLNFCADTTLTNCMFSGNTAYSGGGISNWDNDTNNLMFINCTVSENTATHEGGGIYMSAGTPLLTLGNSILWGNTDSGGTDESAQVHIEDGTLAVDYTCIEGWSGALGGTGNIGDDPLFVDADGDDDIIGTDDDNVRLSATSPCIDAGDNSALPPDTTDLDGDEDTDEQIPFDLDGDPRVIDGTVDMGAYEGPEQSFLINIDPVIIPEGSTETFTVALGADPLGTVNVTVAHESGDVDITVQGGADLIFDSENFSVPQMVTLAAAEDDDCVYGTATIRISAPGIPARDVTAIEADNDPLVLYVDVDATGPTHDGSSWADAFIDLQTALDVVSPGYAILVAEGTYTPDRGTGDREATFQLLNSGTLEGGYAGCGEPDPNARDIEAYETILSGDLNGDDGPDFQNNEENSCHVVTGNGTDHTAILDGFTITAGNATAPGCLYDMGAGMHNFGGSPVVLNCTFVANTAQSEGAGIWNYMSNPAITNCTFVGNLAGSGGGGMDNAESNPTLTNCAFNGNSAAFFGGGMYNGASSPMLTNCTVSGNNALAGGGMVNTGSSHPILVNCVFSGNTMTGTQGQYGGGALANGSDSDPTLINCVFAGNTAPLSSGGALYNIEGADPALTNCILWGNSDSSGTGESAQIYNDDCCEPCVPVVNYSCVQGGWTGAGGIGNISDDPLFLEPDGGDNTVGTEDDNLRLLPGSPCLDAGDNTSVPSDTLDIDDDGDTDEPLPFDLDGDARFVDDPDTPDTGNGTPPIVDMGAYEGPDQGFVIVGHPVTVPEDATGVFSVALGADPLGTVEVLVAHVQGDSDITVLSGDLLTFDSGNFTIPQTVTLAGAEDPDFTNGTALIQVSAPEMFTAGVTAIEADDEPVPSIVFVDEDAGGLNAGTSWTDAFMEVRDALSAAANRPGVSQIWVAAGVYTPSDPWGDRAGTFQLLDGVAVYGGFAGGETSLDERDPRANVTILTGDLNGDDGPDFAFNVENSYHVVTGSGTDATAVLDGFTITGGNADAIFDCADGGGMYINSGSPTVANCEFVENRAEEGGAGMSSVMGASPTVTNCTFVGNVASGHGGGVINVDVTPTFTNCRFIANGVEGASGGGMYNQQSAVRLINCTFGGNVAFRGGAVLNYSGTLTGTNCTFIWNSAESNGGGVYFDGSISATLSNCVLWGNSDSGGTDESAQIGEEGTGTLVVNYTCIQGLTGELGGTGNIGDDPFFVDADGDDDIFGTEDDNTRLSFGSPCIDAGDNAVVPADTDDLDDDGDTDEPIPFDLDGNERFVDDPCVADTGNGTAPIVDMGPWEYPAQSPLAVLFVDRNASGVGDGTSWGNAVTDLRIALAVAACYDDIVTEMWVAAGTYTPAGADGDRTAAFELINGVALYGGFAGSEVSRDERDPVANETILSGDLNGDDASGGDNSENSYHVVTGSGTDTTAILDGFTIMAGNANGGGPDTNFGGGLFNETGSPTVTNCTFHDNSAAGGGGMYNSVNSSPTIANCVFSGNSASSSGGAIYNADNSNPILDRCTFADNSSQGDGGGIYDFDVASPALTACIFYGNTATGLGGAMANEASSAPTITNCVFSGNTTTGSGGAMSDLSASLTLTNCTFSGNAADVSGGGVYSGSGSTPTLSNCVLWGNSDSGGTDESAQIDTDGTGTLAVDYTCVQGLTGGLGGTGNIGDDPLLVDADGTDDVAGTEDDNVRLSLGSPCIDVGDNDADTDANTPDVQPLPPTDLVGNDRVLDGDGDLIAVVDMGAYEFPETAIDNDVDNDETVVLNPGGGSGEPTDDATVEFTNESGSDDATVAVSETTEDLHPEASGFGGLGTTLIIETSLDDGEFFITLTIPFDVDDLGGADPLSVDLMYFDTDAGAWVLAVANNTQPSPGHEPDVVGDRFAVEDTVVPDLSADLGDYGVFWNPDDEMGFVWANVDHATDFAPASLAVPPPMPEDSLGVGCTDDSHCYEGGPATEARCVQGTCYVPKQRYVSIAANPGQVPNTARRVNLDTGDLIGWVDEPYYVPPTSQHDGLWLAEIVSTPHYEEQWSDVVHVTGCGIAHAGLCDVSGDHCGPNACPGGETCEHHSYHVQAIGFGLPIADESYYSEVLALHTPTVWGDTVSTCAGNKCKPPNGLPGLDDIMATISYFMGDKDVAPLVWLDIDPSNLAQSPEQIIGLGDIMGCIAGFQGEAYPGDGPLNCP